MRGNPFNLMDPRAAEQTMKSRRKYSRSPPRQFLGGFALVATAMALRLAVALYTGDRSWLKQ